MSLWLLAAAATATNYKQPGFSERAVFTGLTNPTVVRFLPDGRVLVAEKSGLLKIFPDLTTNTYSVVADLRTEVHNFWDRGLLGLAVDPNFASNNFVYVLYSYDAPIGGSPPRWGVAGQTSDGCPTPPGATTDGCVISGRLSRLTAVGSDWTASEAPLINDWCQQFPSHSIGSLEFGADGYLYVSGGDGASFNNSDWGQFGGTSGTPPPTPANPCGDPPFPVGAPQTKPTAEGGALRSQSHLRTAGEPRVLNGSILRIDPSTGDAAPGNPLIGSGDVNEQRIIGYGLRNPFRMTVRPGTNEVWIADVGWSSREEIDRIPDLTSARNFGWPCYEANLVQYTGLNICPPIGQTTLPYYYYAHSGSVVAGDGCPTGSSSIAGLAFYPGAGNYPSNYPNALFFSDYSRKCLWVMFPGAGGDPNPSDIGAFANTAAGPVFLTIGPDGNLFYVDYDGGRIMEVKYGLAAVATAAPTSGTAPLTVNFDGSGSVPAQPGDTLTYAWDLDGDGQFDDSSAPQPTFSYPTPGTYTVRLKVSDQRGASSTSPPITISAGNTPPTAFVDTPASSMTWKVGDPITFSGHATDDQDGTLPASALSWQVIIHHCPSNCHTHVYQTFSGVASGSFPAPDHEYPCYLEIQLTATDAQGLTGTASVNIQPQTASLMFQTSPTGLQLTVGTSPPQTAPFTQTVIVNSVNTVQATSPQGALPNIWEFSSWSDAGAQNHNVTAPPGSSSYTATYLTHADVAIGASATPEPVGAGLPLTYTLSVSNAGPSQANSVTVTDALPAGASFVSAGGSGWTCGGAGPVTCTLPALAPGAAAPITLVVDAPNEGGSVSNTATVGSATDDPAAGNNSATIPSTVFARADLSIGQTGAPAAICAGAPITYSLNVSNGGPSTAATLTVIDVLPAGATLVSASGAGWSCSGSTTVACTRPSLAPGAAPAITVAITAPASAGTATNAASVASLTSDPSAANNAASASTTVDAIPPAPAAGNSGPVCVGGTLQLTASAVAGATYSWTGPNGFASSLQNPTIAGVTPAAAGVYSVTVSVQGCASPAGSTSVTVLPPPSAVVSGDATICPGSSTEVSAVLTGTGPWSLMWSDGLAQSVESSPASRRVAPSATTVYTVTTVQDALCAATGSGSATVTLAPTVPAPAVSAASWVPVGATGVAASVPAHDGSTYAWTLSGGTIDGGQGSATVAVAAGAPGTTMVLSCAETSAQGCASPEGVARIQVDFIDVPPAHPFHDFVDTIARDGVTAGCGGGNYCPAAPNTRAQMAVFLLKAKFGTGHVPPPASGNVFQDVPASNPFAPWIEELAVLGVTGGCGGGNYCPGSAVTRAQMAVFLLKTLLGAGYAPPAATGIFGDVPVSAFAAAWIEDLYGRGITGGCQASPLRYCPSNPNTRGQMAVFLTKTFGLS